MKLQLYSYSGLSCSKNILLISLLEKRQKKKKIQTNKENYRVAKIQMSIFPLGNTRTENEVKISYCAMWRDRETLRNMGPTLDCFEMSPKFYHFLTNRLIYQEIPLYYFSHVSAVMRGLMIEIHSETCVVRWLVVRQSPGARTKPGGRAYRTPRPRGVPLSCSCHHNPDVPTSIPPALQMSDRVRRPRAVLEMRKIKKAH